MDIKDILARCDHTLLRTDCTAAEIRALCDDAIRFGCASVCIPPAHVAGAKRYVNGQMKICTVIGFPNGYNTTAAKEKRRGRDRYGHQSRHGEGQVLGHAA